MAETQNSTLPSNHIKDLRGVRFGKLIVASFAFLDSAKKACWICVCDCGNITKPIRGNNLKTGGQASCGCYKMEQISVVHRVHGEAIGKKTKEYRAWREMKRRCLDPKRQNYPRYGGRGIEVCERWQSGYLNFLEDMGRCPDGCSLDRIDNSKGYFPQNCKWSTDKQQRRNKRNNIWVNYNGERMILSDLTRLIGVNEKSFRSYYCRRMDQDINSIVSQYLHRVHP